MKPQRHAAILRVVRGQHVQSQEQLRKLLRELDIEVTQATLSRDIHELRLVKITDSTGASYYAPPNDGDVLRPSLSRLLSTLLVSLDSVGNLLVIRTPAGSANALGSAIDLEGWEEVMGTVAGDDTILIIARSAKNCRSLVQRLRDLAGLTP
ncbi:MAG: arginine repressor [Gemmatimonadales bacterium]